MKKTKSILSMFLILLLIISLMGCSNQASDQPDNQDEQTSNQPDNQDEQTDNQNIELRMATATPGGTWYTIGVAVGEAIMKELPGVTVTVGSGGSQANIISLENGETDIAMVYSADMVLAQRGEEPFTDKAVKMKDMVSLFDSPYQVTVLRDSGIETFNDLIGKKLGTVQMGTGGEYLNRLVLDTYGITYDDLDVQFAGNSDLIDMMKDGHIDASANTGGVPFPLIMEIGAFNDVRVLSVDKDIMDKVIEINPGYRAYTIPAGIYSDQGNPEEVNTLSTTTRLAISSDISDELVEKIVAAIAKSLPDLGNVLGSMKGMEPLDLYQDISIEHHPGAMKYYDSLK